MAEIPAHVTYGPFDDLPVCGEQLTGPDKARPGEPTDLNVDSCKTAGGRIRKRMNRNMTEDEIPSAKGYKLLVGRRFVLARSENGNRMTTVPGSNRAMPPHLEVANRTGPLLPRAPTRHPLTGVTDLKFFAAAARQTVKIRALVGASERDVTQSPVFRGSGLHWLRADQPM
jgi:hypothetical protein